MTAWAIVQGFYFFIIPFMPHVNLYSSLQVSCLSLQDSLDVCDSLLTHSIQYIQVPVCIKWNGCFLQAFLTLSYILLKRLYLFICACVYVYLCTCGEIREQLVKVAFPFTMWEGPRDETLSGQMANVLTHRVILLALGYMLTLMTLF